MYRLPSSLLYPTFQFAHLASNKSGSPSPHSNNSCSMTSIVLCGGGGFGGEEVQLTIINKMDNNNILFTYFSIKMPMQLIWQR